MFTPSIHLHYQKMEKFQFLVKFSVLKYCSYIFLIFKQLKNFKFFAQFDFFEKCFSTEIFEKNICCRIKPWLIFWWIYNYIKVVFLFFNHCPAIWALPWPHLRRKFFQIIFFFFFFLMFAPVRMHLLPFIVQRFNNFYMFSIHSLQ